MTKVYDVYLKRHKGSSRSNIVQFWDEDRNEAIKYMKKYVKENGFSIVEKDGRFTIADVVLRERTPSGKVISEISYINIGQ